MADEYWVIIEMRRWKKLPFKRQFFFKKNCEYKDVRDFVDELRIEHPDNIVRLGVTRGDTIYLL